MRIAETVTFSGGGLDRAADLRKDAAALAAAGAEDGARYLPVFEGRPLVAETGLGWMRRDELPDGCNEPVLLCRDAGTTRFAVEIAAGALPAGTEALPGRPGLAFSEIRAVMTRLTPADAECAATSRAIFGWHRSHAFCAACGSPSRMVEAGWRRDCPSCGAQHFPRTDPVVIMLITRGNSVLLGRSPHWPERMFSLLAGFVEPGETIEAAVRREVLEETQVRVGPVSYLASQPWPFPSSLMIGCRGEATSDQITIDPVEIEEAMWLTREEVGDAFADAHPRVAPARAGSIAQFLLWNWLADRLD
ncbi:NAD(+) diphosphatase [Tropicimonas sp. IMCC34011]|uniref:NAD(+) diphosphatase n=1 Tax=Tropicimonas sp. IMCC34011 TaxID=2248759 RepID=UPI000E21EBB0|nr:NAD(+) diphosphatase [Tropicimonas sp. IMCC34011]